MEVTIIGYGVGNLRNLRCRLERADATVALSDDPSTVADHTAVSCDYGFDFAAIASNDAATSWDAVPSRKERRHRPSRALQFRPLRGEVA